MNPLIRPKFWIAAALGLAAMFGLGTPAFAGYGPTATVYDHVGADNEKPSWDKGDAAFDQLPEAGVGWYQVWQDGVNVRSASRQSCRNYPSTGNCTPVLGTVSRSDSVHIWCQKQGQTVGNNPWWVRVNDTTKTGLRNINAYMASYYINVPQNKIPGVPICTD